MNLDQHISTVTTQPQTYQEHINSFVGRQISGRLRGEMMSLRACILRDAESKGIEVNQNEEYSRMLTEIDHYLRQIPDHL